MNKLLQPMLSRTNENRMLIALAMLMVLSVLMPLSAKAAPEAAGYVLMASGDFHAVQTNQALRKLERKSPFYSGEVLRTGPDSKAQVRFRDGSLIALRADTEIRIDEFRYEEPAKGEDKNIFTLLNGGFRTITGKIGKKNPENYQMKSSVASIGVRGTTYEVVLDHGLNVAAWQGTIVVANDAGTMALGKGADYNFAVVPDSGRMPQGMLAPPPVIMVNEGKSDVGTGPATSEQEQNVNKMPLSGGIASLTQTTQSDTTGVIAMLADSVISLPATQQTQNPAQSTTQITVPSDVRLSATEKTSLDRIGLFTFVNALAGTQQYRGLASNGATSGPLLTRVDLPLSDPNFFTVDPTWVVRQGSSVISASHGISTPTAYAVTWGTWDATTATPVTLQTDKTDATIVTNQPAPVMWMTVLPTDKTVLAGMSGGAAYTTMLANYGLGSGGSAVSDTHVLVNFNTATFSGYTHVMDLGSIGDWSVKYTGVFSGVSLEVTALDGVYSGSQGVKQAVAGRIDFIFTGATPDALAGAYEFELVSNPAAYVQGQFVTERDFRLSATEALGMNQVALIATQGNSVLARTTDLTSATPVIGSVAGWALPGGFGFLEAKYTDVMRKGTATNLVATASDTTYATHPVSWGAWSSGWVAQTDATNPATQTNAAQSLYWMQLTPTDPAIVAARTGSFGYSAVAVLGGGSGGAINSGTFSASAIVDFTTGNLNSGTMSFSDAAAGNWVATFTGAIKGSAININPSLITYNGDSANPATGKINAVFTGPNAQMLGGSFGFNYAPTTQSVQGVFLTTCSPGC